MEAEEEDDIEMIEKLATFGINAGTLKPLEKHSYNLLIIPYR